MASSLPEPFEQLVKRVSPLLENDLRSIVGMFEEIIDSRRTSSRIMSFEDLVAVLVKRDYVKPDDSSTWIVLNEVCEKYLQQPFGRTAQTAHTVKSPKQHAATLISQEEIDYLSTHISFSWRNFARGLHLTQFSIDDIEVKHGNNYSACVKEVLLTYMKEMLYTSRSNGNAREDILVALKPLPQHLSEHFQRLKKTTQPT